MNDEGTGSRVRRRALLLAAACASACSGDGCASSANGGSSVGAPPGPAEVARAEFDGSYGDDDPPTGTLRSFALTAAPTTLPLLDGLPLDVWAYDGQVPGPTLRVRRGDTVRVDFRNDLPQPTTVHWHGVRVPNGMDGVPHVTQPPVPPGGTFRYEFVARDAGTFWFHPHLRGSEQVERGLHGVLVVEDETPSPYAREEVWVIDDWRLAPSGQIDPAFNTRHDLGHDGRWGDVITVNGHRSPTMEVRPGERLRLRIVNVANGRVFKLDFGSLVVRGIAVDGLAARAPFDPGSFEMAPGNRLDLDVLVPPASPAADVAVVDRFTRRVNPVATFRVRGEAAPRDGEGSAEPPPLRHRRVPTWFAAGESPLAAELRLNARQGGPLGVAWTINGRAMDHEAHDGRGALAFSLPSGRFARVAFVNDSARIHPMHLHGTFFKVLSRNGVAVDEPFFRDTALVHARERVEIGLVPLDEGTWMMHCHILEHAEAGMMTLFRVESTAPTR